MEGEIGGVCGRFLVGLLGGVMGRFWGVFGVWGDRWGDKLGLLFAKSGGTNVGKRGGEKLMEGNIPFCSFIWGKRTLLEHGFLAVTPYYI